eukprot:11568412-Prorocentrum_lima.AAC.1
MAAVIPGVALTTATELLVATIQAGGTMYQVAPVASALLRTVIQLQVEGRSETTDQSTPPDAVSAELARRLAM